MSETKITDGDLAGITARAKRDVYVEIGRLLYETGGDADANHEVFGGEAADCAEWAKTVQTRLRDDLGIQLYRGGDEIPGGVDSNLVMAFVKDPPSTAIALALNLAGARTCECGRAPCMTWCGVYFDLSTSLWTVMPQEWRLDWLARISLMHAPGRRAGPRLLELCGPHRLAPEWLVQSTTVMDKIIAAGDR